MRLKVSRVLVTAGLLAAAMLQCAAAQNITIDGHLSPAQTLVGPSYAITANLGKQVGSNLFHSFGTFGLSTGEAATFSGPATVSNVIGRVTGGAQSAIDGKIASTITGASLYLINPSGIVFGPNASVNVSGSFHASTADYVKMSDGAKFQATNPDASTLSAAPPAAFGFLTAQPAKITVNGSSFGVPSRQTLGLVGGPVSIKSAATLSAPAGTIHVTSAAGIGEVPVDPRNTAALTVTSFGPVKIKGGAAIDVSNADALGGGGSVFIRSGALTIDASDINADNYSSDPGGVISLRGDKQITLSNGAYVHAVAMGSGNGADVSLSTTSSGAISADAATVLTDSLGPGNGGTLSLEAGRLTVTNGAGLITSTQGRGNGGQITISAGSVVLDGSAVPDEQTGVFSTTSGVAPGAGSAGKINVGAGILSIVNAGLIASSTTGYGDSGAVSAKVSENLSIAGANAGIFSFSTSESAGNAGKIIVGAEKLSIDDGGRIDSSAAGSGDNGDVSIKASESLSIAGASTGIFSRSTSGGNAGRITVGAGTLFIANNGVISASTNSTGNAGDVTVAVSGLLTIDGSEAGATGIFSNAEPGSSGAAGTVRVSAGTLLIADDGVISSISFSARDAGNVTVAVSGLLTIDGSEAGATGIFSNAEPGSGGAGGIVRVSAGTLLIANGGEISSTTFATGDAGRVSVTVSDELTIDGLHPGAGATGIFSQADRGSSGSAGTVSVSVGNLVIANDGVISSRTLGSGNGGSVLVTARNLEIIKDSRITTDTQGPGSGNAGDLSLDVAGRLTIDGMSQTSFTGISSRSTQGSGGNAGEVKLSADSLSIANRGAISTTTDGLGAGGRITVAVAIDSSLSTGGQITSATAGAGVGGIISVTAQGALSLGGAGTGITASATSTASGNAGSVMVTAPRIAIINDAKIASTTAGTGMGGSVVVTTPGTLALDGAGVANTQIAASATGPQSGEGGSVTVGADTLTIAGGAQIASTTASTLRTGKGGDIAVTVNNGVTLSGSGPNGASGISAAALPGSSGQAGEVVLSAGGAIALSGGAQATSSTAGMGNGGSVQIAAGGPLNLTGSGTGIIASATATASGDAGSVIANAPQITLSSGAEISSTTAGTGAGGSVVVTTPGILVLDGAGVANTQIAASATGPQSGQGGSVTVGADMLTVEGGAQIASSTAGPGKGGDVRVTVGNGVALSGVGPTGASGITAAAQPGSSGRAGEVALSAGGAIGLSGGAEVTSSTAGVGNGGSVQVTAGGPLTLTGSGTGIIASATAAASGDAGSVIATAPQITVISGAEISSTTAGTGAGGSVVVTTPGMLALDGAGVANTQIAASATGPRSGSGGSVTVAANSLTIQGGARIASSTAGPGTGGDVNIAVASDILLPDPGPQITARSTGGGEAGSITVSAVRLMMNNGASISTEAETSTANGGNITLHLRDFLYLVSSEISTSVKGETGNGGNIVIDPQLVILNHSSIIAQAIEGHGGNITITAGQFIPSTDSVVSATSELGISGTIVINGPRVDVNGALVVLSSQLRGRTEVLREACEARTGRPISSLVEAGRGGLPQDPEATLPALYIAGRDLNPNPRPDVGNTEASSTVQTTVWMTMRCG